VSQRCHPGIKGRRPDRKERRRALALGNQAVREELSPSSILALLDRKLGVGVGAKRERARLATKMRRAKMRRAS
jgi:hypothetical protein